MVFQFAIFIEKLVLVFKNGHISWLLLYLILADFLIIITY